MGEQTHLEIGSSFWQYVEHLPPPNGLPNTIVSGQEDNIHRGRERSPERTKFEVDETIITVQ